MKIICAPDSFKETISARDAALAMSRGVHRAHPSAAFDICPVADGGEGTLDALITATGGTIHNATVTGPLGQPINARYGIVTQQSLGVVELAEASGLALVPLHLRNPFQTTTYGTGELIRHAMSNGCSAIIVCIGGSATVDGATGIAQALGAVFRDHKGNAIEGPMRGGLLSHIAAWSPPEDMPRIDIACDVTNVLCGPRGAAAVYGPQKGATPEQVKQLDAGLANLASVIGHDANFAGAGAAGGAGYGLVAMCGGRLQRGIDLVLDAIGFDERCCDAALVITGEGRLDEQSLQGKATMGVASRAARFNVPTVAVVGSAGHGANRCIGPTASAKLQQYVSLSERFGEANAMAHPAQMIEQATCDLVRQFCAARAR